MQIPDPVSFPAVRRFPSLVARAVFPSLVFLSLVYLAVLPASARDDEEPLQTFEEEQDVFLVEVPVNVTDRDGHPIRGLEADDFELRDEGEVQEIEGFEVIDLEVLDPARHEVEDAVERLPPVARRHFLLLFDLSFSTPSSIVRARQATRDFVLEKLHPTDLAAVATFSLEQGPRLLLTFTPDRAQLARAIDTLGIPGLTQQGAVVDPLRFVIAPPIDVPEIQDARQTDGRVNLDQILNEQLNLIQMARERSQKSFERRRISAWSRSLGEIARALGTLEGRKHVLYFSEGFDGSLLFGRDASRTNIEAQRDQFLRETGQLWLVDQDDTFGNTALQGDVADMIETFRRADCMIQAVDIGGLRAETSVTGLSQNQVAPRLNDSTDALFYVADSTGGELFENADDFGSQLEEVMERNSVTYVLSFHPSDASFDGEFHRLKVKADLPRGARVSHRSGYWAPKDFQRLHPLEKALLASEAIASAVPREDFSMDLLAAAFRASPELAYVPVILEIDGRSLLRGHESDDLGLEIYVYVTDRKGEMRDFVTQAIGLRLDEETRRALESGGVKFYGHVDLAPDRYLLRVLARNAQTGRTSVASQPLVVPEWEERQPYLLPPFFFDVAGGWTMVREQHPETPGGGEVVYPFLVGDETFVPAAGPRLGSKPAGLALFGYHLGRDLALESTILDADGEPVQGGRLELVERTDAAGDGVEKLLARFDPKGLDPGTYELRVAVVDLASGERRESSVEIRVEG